MSEQLYTNSSIISEGRRVVSQTPIDDRLYFDTQAAIAVIDTDNPSEPYRFYEGMIVYAINNGKQFMWKESATGILTSGGFTYPSSFVVANVDYSNRTFNFVELNKPINSYYIRVFDKNTVITTEGIGVKGSFVVPFDMEIMDIYAGMDIAPTGTKPQLDVELNGGGSLFSTTITIDALEYSSYSAAIPPVLSTTILNAGDILLFSIDAVDGGGTGAGLWFQIISYQL